MQRRSEPEIQSPKTSSLLDQIRDRGKQPRKKISNDHPDYQYVIPSSPTEESGAGGMLEGLRAKINPDTDKISIEQKILDGLSKKDQKNMLYSAMIDKNEERVQNLLKHESEFSTGEQNEWDEDITKKQPTFSPEEIETIRKAAKETELRVAAGIDLKPTHTEFSPTTSKTADISKVVETVLDIPPPPTRIDTSPSSIPTSPRESSVSSKALTFASSTRVVSPLADRGNLLEQIKVH